MKLFVQYPQETRPEPVSFPAGVVIGRTVTSLEADLPTTFEDAALLLVPLATRRGNVAAWVRPVTARLRATVKGRPPGPIGRLAHGDVIDVAEGPHVWVAAESQVREEEYDCEVHGDALYCARTNVRIAEGRVVRCPGPNCEAIFSQKAWEALSHLRCPRCRHDPAEGDWRPTPILPTGRGLRDLLGLVAATPTDDLVAGGPS